MMLQELKVFKRMIDKAKWQTARKGEMLRKQFSLEGRMSSCCLLIKVNVLPSCRELIHCIRFHSFSFLSMSKTKQQRGESKYSSILRTKENRWREMTMAAEALDYFSKKQTQIFSTY